MTVCNSLRGGDPHTRVRLHLFAPRPLPPLFLSSNLFINWGVEKLRRTVCYWSTKNIQPNKATHHEFINPKLALIKGFVFVTWTEPGEDGKVYTDWIPYKS